MNENFTAAEIRQTGWHALQRDFDKPAAPLREVVRSPRPEDEAFFARNRNPGRQFNARIRPCLPGEWVDVGAAPGFTVLCYIIVSWADPDDPYDQDTWTSFPVIVSNAVAADLNWLNEVVGSIDEGHPVMPPLPPHVDPLVVAIMAQWTIWVPT